MTKVLKLDHIKIAAATIWGEARGESDEGKRAVAEVIWNRVYGKSWFGNDLQRVCQKRWQFSVWNPNDPNRAKLERLTWKTLTPYGDLILNTYEVGYHTHDHIAGNWNQHHQISGGATHYMNVPVVKKMRGGSLPSWVKRLTEIKTIGHHTFYK